MSHVFPPPLKTHSRSTSQTPAQLRSLARDVAACRRNQAEQRMLLEYHHVSLRSVVERQEMAIRPGPALAGDEAALCQLVARVGGNADGDVEPTQLVGLDVWEEGMWKPADRDRQLAGIAHLRSGANRASMQRDGAF